MARNIVIAVDAKERTLDALALGSLLAGATHAPAALLTVFAYDPFNDPDGPELREVRDDSHATLVELADAEGLRGAEARVIARATSRRASRSTRPSSPTRASSSSPLTRLAFGSVATAALPSISGDDEMRRGLEAIHGEAVARAGEVVEVEGRFLDGSADDVLGAQADELDLLMVGSRGYGPLGAVLLGSTSSHVARTASCPVLVTPRDTSLDPLD